MTTLITGAGVGLGASLADALESDGHQVVRHTRAEGDFSTREGVERYLKYYLSHHPQTDYLINNVGNYLVKPASETTVDEWYDLFQTNLHAPFILTKALAPQLKAVVNIGVAGLHKQADSYSTAYTLTKKGLWHLTASLAKELAPKGTRINMVSPGYLENSVDSPIEYPMGRSTTFNETVRVVQFLLDDANGHVTGQNIEVAGAVRL